MNLVILQLLDDDDWQLNFLLQRVSGQQQQHPSMMPIFVVTQQVVGHSPELQLARGPIFPQIFIQMKINSDKYKYKFDLKHWTCNIFYLCTASLAAASRASATFCWIIAACFASATRFCATITLWFASFACWTARKTSGVYAIPGDPWNGSFRVWNWRKNKLLFFPSLKIDFISTNLLGYIVGCLDLNLTKRKISWECSRPCWSTEGSRCPGRIVIWRNFKGIKAWRAQKCNTTFIFFFCLITWCSIDQHHEGQHPKKLHAVKK